MAVILALEKLFDDVLQRFVDEGTFGDVPPLPPVDLSLAARANTFGWREPARQGGPLARIVWVPGDDGTGSLGEVTAPRYPGRLDPGRPLGTLDELFTVYLSAADTTVPQTLEREQYHATRLLYDAWYRAIYKAAHGTFRIVSQTWVNGTHAGPRQERRFGAAIRVVGGIQAMIPDSTPTIVSPPLEADITVSEGNTADTAIVITNP